ncbi:hypothetical protein CEXT_4091, partial [Caerostris extrusa]
YTGVYSMALRPERPRENGGTATSFLRFTRTGSA